MYRVLFGSSVELYAVFSCLIVGFPVSEDTRMMFHVLYVRFFMLFFIRVIKVSYAYRIQEDITLLFTGMFWKEITLFNCKNIKIFDS